GLGAWRWFELVKGYDWTWPDLHDLAAHAEMLQHRFKQARILLQRFLGRDIDTFGRQRRQEIERRQLVLFSDQIQSCLRRTASAAQAGRLLDARSAARRARRGGRSHFLILILEPVFEGLLIVPGAFLEARFDTAAAPLGGAAGAKAGGAPGADAASFPGTGVSRPHFIQTP